jgi:hypothetical protein
MIKYIALILVFLGCSIVKADSIVGKNVVGKDLAVTYLPQRHHAATSTGTRVIRGKPLFKYPKENLVYIVTYTQDDLARMKQDKFMRDLENPASTGLELVK